ncbi:hypothetical protein [Natronobacterium texcoconense]|uniref:Uncharacterized protein n=1 Tax=Natronobacterium texcoconense TaxID=1095778 RepID=A0A1H1IAZ1_NATTX|nr:hypothetical protein [Natronobacterium texcoconense]SDR34528.1 hypothetical protein SAMN04489842_3351 [Natronobacterium texcoconense]
MSAGAVFVVFLLGILLTIAVWAAILGETSNATVLDRDEAERLARERGGRGFDRARSSERDDRSGANGDERSEAYGWGVDESNWDDDRQ